LLLDELSSAAPRGAQGLSFNPMEDVPDLSGYSKQNIARALMEGIAYALKARMGDIVKIERITMCGGPSVSPVWRAVLADIFGVPVNVTYGPHSGAVGAAMYALK
jgi:xylulokinase